MIYEDVTPVPACDPRPCQYSIMSASFTSCPVFQLRSGAKFIITGDIDHCYELAQQLSDLSISDENYHVCTGQCIKAVTVVQVVD